jgi:serine/threonine protein phosphatase PrpC
VTKLRVGSATDTGQVRTKNEDAALIGDAVFAVADGMGGHAAGDVASRSPSRRSEAPPPRASTTRRTSSRPSGPPTRR